MIPTKITDHVARARALLIEQHRNSVVTPALQATYTRRLQEIEDTLWDIFESHQLATATGAQLDDLGTIVVEDRHGRSDVNYRAAIRIKIRANRSLGRSVDVLDVAIMAAPNHTPIYIEYPLLAFEVDTFGEEGEAEVAKILKKTRMAGCYGIFVASDSEDVLMFDDAVSPTGIPTFTHEGDSGPTCASAYAL